MNSLVNNEKQSHCIYHTTHTHQKKTNKTHKKQHSHSRCNCVRKKKHNRTARITPTNDEATKKNIIHRKQQNHTAVKGKKSKLKKEEQRLSKLCFNQQTQKS